MSCSECSRYITRKDDMATISHCLREISNKASDKSLIAPIAKYFYGLSHTQAIIGIVILIAILIAISHWLSLKFYKEREF